MKAKWYLSTFIIVLTLLGVSLEQYSTPNQEIVVQFANNEVSLFETQNTIAIVKKQLQDIGVENINVQENENGTLKISYHSDIDVASIKRLFSTKKFDLGLADYNTEGSSNVPSGDKSNDYQLDVNEIQKSNETDSDFNGIVVDVRQKSDRFFNPAVNSVHEFEVRDVNKIEKVAYIIQKNIALAIDNSSHNIPEVRAGPLA